jgi:N6-L-threonylcarbamoyladenine synthase
VTILAFETSCDETSAAVIRDGTILSSVVSSQIKLHAEYGGVVPELAAREHLRNLMPVTHTALKEAGVAIGDVDASAATQGPGCRLRCWLVASRAGAGVCVAKALHWD